MKTHVVVAAGIAFGGLACGCPGRAADVSRVQVAWRNDPRPVADESLPAEPPVGRRLTRREHRRLRRSEAEPRGGAIPDPAVPPQGRFVPAVSPAGRIGAVVHRDVPSGGHPRQRFDLHLPAGHDHGGLPLVAWISGTDWRGGTTADCPVAWLVGQGFAVASIDHRPCDAARHPAQLDDCLAALETIRHRAAAWGIDASRVCVAGAGAGGHLAALVALAPGNAGRTCEPPAGVAAVAVFDSPTHLPSLGGAHDRAGSAASRLVGGPLQEFREAAQRASPVIHASAAAPPMLIVHAGRGDGVPLDQAGRLDAALRTAGAESSLVVLDATAADVVPADGTTAAGTLLEFLGRTLDTRPAGPSE